MTPSQKAKEIAEEKYPYPELNPEINNTLVRFRIDALREGYAAALLSGEDWKEDGVDAVIETQWDGHSISVPEDSYEPEKEYADLVAGKQIMFKGEFVKACKELINRETWQTTK